MASNSWRRSAGGRRGGKHNSVVELNTQHSRKRDLLRPLNTSFSHIQIVPNPSSAASVDKSTTDEESSAQVVFQRPSYTESAREIMAASSNPEGFASKTASLASNKSGTTFAAKARAAELNAVRSRRAAQEAEAQSEVPPIPPMPLGAIKFTRHRNRARAWKALNLDELAEQTIEEEESQSEHMPSVESFRQPPYQQTNSESTDSFKSFPTHQNSPITEPVNRPDIKVTLPQNQSSIVSSRQLTPENTCTPHSHYPCNKDSHQAMPAIHASRPTSPLNTLTPEQSSRALSALDYNARSGIAQDAGGQSFSAPPGLFPVQTTKASQLALENSANQQRLNWAEEMRLKSLGVLPAFQPSQGRPFANNYAKDKNHDDPFTEPPLASAYRSTELAYPYNSIPAPRGAPPAVKGTTSAEFRFPQSYQPHNFASPQYSNPKSEQAQVPSNVLRSNPPYQRDPLPYSAFLSRNNLGPQKKEMLLQNLENVVESSKTEGHLPSSTRTVLYDPLALSALKPAQPSPTEAAFKRAQEEATKRSSRTSAPNLGITEQERLEISDPLPWTDRPVSIEDSPTLITQASLSRKASTQSDHLAVGFIQSPPSRFAVQPQPQHHTHDQIESWWFDRSRRDALLHGQPTIPPKSKPTAAEIARGVMLPAYKTLLSYAETTEHDSFGRFGRVPEWCIDRTPGGSQSFYGDWGVPPSRVGRDPRYTPTFHEGRYTVFEEPSRSTRLGGGFGHR